MFLKSRTLSIPLFWKFAIISSIIVFLFGIINIYLLWSSVYTSFEKEIDKRCKVLARIVAEKALTPMVYDDVLNIYTILDEIKQSDPSISYIFIISSDNILMANTYGVNINQSLLKANALRDNKYNIEVIKTSNYKDPVIRDIAYPILDGEIGTVRLGIVEEHIQQEIKDATENMLIMILAFFIFGLFGALFFSYVITSPIKEISTKAQIIDLNIIEETSILSIKRRKRKFLNIQVNDELDILVTKFSQMINRLKLNYKELKETQGALFQAEKLASLGTLSAGVAHEINNPISGIKNCTNRIIKDPENTERNKQYILLIKEATEKIELVVQQLLNFSHKQDFQIEKVNIVDRIRNAIALVEHKAQSNNIKLHTRLSNDFFINGSGNHLEQVFVNLILNSIDAIVERRQKEANLKGSIEIKILRKSDRVYTYVRDNGIGISKDIQSNIYDPFFTSKEVGKGTGLGLSVSFNIINKHKGSISFQTNEMKGTDFIIELPCFK